MGICLFESICISGHLYFLVIVSYGMHLWICLNTINSFKYLKIITIKMIIIITKIQ